ncbi:hypothetical protein [Bradyrhizobium sp. dw_411]|uniref:hypothetical protein n=1 Tax=Bradyrhizobium sp. dw_411 TaxID=2720082 RepID=UPI001BCF528E|nr:hypothetical protein [Bradyrhizobium sp. dw_411]
MQAFGSTRGIPLMEVMMIRNWAANVANRGVALIASLLMRSAIKSLLEIDERSLRAAGLSRADLIECLSTPFTVDPTELLVLRSRAARSRRSVRRVSRAGMRRGVAPTARAFSRAHQF